jgi:hypothetical protein
MKVETSQSDFSLRFLRANFLLVLEPSSRRRGRAAFRTIAAVFGDSPGPQLLYAPLPRGVPFGPGTVGVLFGIY